MRARRSTCASGPTTCATTGRAARSTSEPRPRVGGETVWRGTSTYLQRSGGARAPGPRADAAEPPAGSRSGAAGEPRPSLRAPSPVTAIPIHLSRVSARAFGFPRAIAHGMWMNARVLGALEARLPDGYTVDVAFKTPAFLPSEVAFGAEQTPDGWRLVLGNARSGKPHLAATIGPVLPIAS